MPDFEWPVAPGVRAFCLGLLVVNAQRVKPPFRAEYPRRSSLNKSYGMKLSAHNQFKGTVEEIQLGGVMAHIGVRVGENLNESVITRRSAEEMALKKGDTLKAVIKSIEVMLQKD